jgi:Raf kinase inhibitor-like YbhB/YbcL family protein
MRPSNSTHLDREPMMTLSITSPAFGAGERIPARYTCEGEDISPPLEFAGIPEGTRSLVLIVDDPDAPDPKAPKRIWVHWLIYNLSPETTRLEEGASGHLPGGAKEGVNDSGEIGYGGPCPPIGVHRYYHRLYALDCELPDLGAPNRATLEEAMRGHVIASAELMGTYELRKD